MILGCYVSRCVRTNRRSPAILSGALSAGRRPQLSARPFVYVDHLPEGRTLPAADDGAGRARSDGARVRRLLEALSAN